MPIGEIYLNQKTYSKIFFEVWIRFHKGGDRMEFLHPKYFMPYTIPFKHVERNGSLH